MTLLALILLCAGIATIFLESKVYAASEKSNNTPGCDCKPVKSCPKSEGPGAEHKKCRVTWGKCTCQNTNDLYQCNNDYIAECLGDREDGCGKCSEDDCNIDSDGCGGEGCYPKNCGPCYKWIADKNSCIRGDITDGCKGDECRWILTTIDSYIP